MSFEGFSIMSGLIVTQVSSVYGQLHKQVDEISSFGPQFGGGVQSHGQLGSLGSAKVPELQCNAGQEQEQSNGFKI